MKRNYFVFLIILILPLLSYGQWVIQPSGFSTPLRGIQHIWAVNENVAWATAFDDSGQDSVIQEFTRTTNGGATWTPGFVNGVAGYEPTMIFALNADTAWITYYHPDNDGGKIMRTSNGGQTWVHQSTAIFADTAEAYPNLIYFWNANEGFAMGDPTNDYFEIYTTNNGGNLWTRIPSASIPTLISGEWGFNTELSVVGNTVWFGTSKGRLLRSTDKGHNWTAINTPFLSTGKARMVQFRDTLNGIIADRISNQLVIYETSNGGATWQAVTPTGTSYANDLCYIPGTPATFISSGNASGFSGAAISYDGCHTWSDISMSPGTKYGSLGFPNQLGGWAGQVNTSSTTGGMAKYTGPTVNIAENPEEASLLLFPNPATSQLTVRVFNVPVIKELQLMDGLGKMVCLEQNIANGSTIALPSLPEGIYLVKVITDKGIYDQRLLIGRP